MMCLEVYELLYFLINNRFNHATEKKTIFFKVKFVYIGCELQVDHFDHFVFCLDVLRVTFFALYYHILQFKIQQSCYITCVLN